MSDPDSFAREIKTLAATFQKEVDATVRKAALIIDQAVVLGTPVDTGRARSNWVVGLDGAPKGVREPYAAGKGLGAGETANAGAALAQGSAEIGQYNGDRNSSIHITNNLPYIERLNDGWSAQAPAGFVDQAIQAATVAVDKAKILK